MLEEWRDVIGYKGLYEVSNWGRVRRAGHYLKNGDYREPRILLPNAFCGVDLHKNGETRKKYIAHLVYSAFIGPTKNYTVMHKDGDLNNNRLDNLQLRVRQTHHRESTTNLEHVAAIWRKHLEENLLKSVE